MFPHSYIFSVKCDNKLAVTQGLARNLQRERLRYAPQG